MLRLPLKLPAPVGTKFTLIVQLAPASKLWGQPLDMKKPDGSVILIMVIAAVPLLVTVIGFSKLFMPACRKPKLRLTGETLILPDSSEFRFDVAEPRTAP